MLQYSSVSSVCTLTTRQRINLELYNKDYYDSIGTQSTVVNTLELEMLVVMISSVYWENVKRSDNPCVDYYVIMS